MKKKEQSTGAQLALISGLKFWNQAISLVKTMAISRMFSLSEYGTYTKMLLVLDFAFAFIVLNLPSSATYFVAKADKEKDRKSFIMTFTFLCTFVGIVMGIILSSAAPLFGDLLKSSAIRNYGWFLGITSITQVIPKANYYVLTAQGKSRTAAVISFSSSLLLLLSLYIASESSNSFTVCLLLMICIEAIETIISYVLLIKSGGGIKNLRNINLYFDPKLVKKIYKYIIPVGLSSVILMINTRVDKVLVSLTSGDDYYAIYANASKELPVAALSVAVASVIVPKLVKSIISNKKQSAILTWKHALVFVSVFSFLLLFGTEVFAPEIMTIIYSSKYVSGVDIFRVYLLLIPFHCIGFTLLLNALGETKYIFRSSVISLVVNIILDIIGLLLIGYIGLGIATVISTIIMVVLQLRYSALLLNVKFSELIPCSELLRLVVINLMFAVLFYFIKSTIPLDSIVGNVLEAVIFGLIWSVLYVLVNIKLIKTSWKGINKEV